MSWSRKASRLLVAVTLTGTVAIAFPPRSSAQEGSFVGILTIRGEPVVANTLTAVPLPDDEESDAEYRWQRCAGEQRSDCAPIAGAGSRTYVVTAADVGSRLAVRALYELGGMQLDTWSALTSVVPGPPASESPPSPPAAPVVATPAAPAARRPLRYLRPFPIVRIKGWLLAGGARVSLLRVTAPRAATVDVRCDGPGCHLRRSMAGSSRIGALERFLRAGTRITIRVSKPHRRREVRADRDP